MSSAKFAASFLAAREARQDLLSRALRAGRPAALFVSLNLPGPDKSPPSATALFRRGGAQIAASFPGSLLVTAGCDALGHFALRVLDADPLAVKRLCIGIEESQEVAGGEPDRQIPRRRRSCILLPHPANRSPQRIRDPRRAIGGPVIDHDDLIGRPGLPENALQRFREKALAVVHRHDAAHPRGGHGVPPAGSSSSMHRSMARPLW